ncbi:hypothetical protein [Arsenicibacter rosenii]|uniref:Uncharacterized protein n=1 Tax=Arsenicibacter rosenii TaxID=1750698 RepID=A0A1S2VJB9_9BACT|nr:hypothetical protein [Arsenicibacter rosenii]OIN58852.1 hypothetical protein BLX24_11510 [Arsenicibacter rosenii]
MKKILLSIFLICYTILYASGQSYDFQSQRFQNIGPVKNGSRVVFKVENINTFRYKVNIEGANVIYVTSVPVVLQQLFGLEESTEKAAKTTEGVAEATGAKEDMASLANSLAGVAPAAGLKREMDVLVSLCKTFIDKASAVNKIILRRNELIMVSKQKWQTHTDLLSAMPGPAFSISSMHNSIQEFWNTYQTAETQYEIALEEAKATPSEADDKRIAMALERFEEGYHKINDDENLLKMAKDVAVLQNTLINPANFMVSSAPIQATGDFLTFKVTIEPVETNALLPYEAKQVAEVEIPVKSGLKIDFSVGPAFSFGRRANSESYTLTAVESNTSLNTLRDATTQNKVVPGLAAMMHMCSRIGKNLAVGGMFGVGTNFTTDNIKVSYYVGISAVLGKAQKLIFSGGASLLWVDKLKDYYKAGDSYDRSLSTADFVEKVYRFSPFLSISYNLAKKEPGN